MFKCEQCGEIFEEPLKIKISYEEFYGVGHLFKDFHPLTICECPNCKSENIEEVRDDEYSMFDWENYPTARIKE